MSRAISETEILTQRDPSLDDKTDEWPEFKLNNVHIHPYGEPDTAVSLLEASVGYPVTVIGQLEPLDDEDAHLYLKPPGKKRVNVVLEKVYFYSYGQYGDGSFAIWAAGKAGWYTLKPSRAYKEIYDGMVEAVNLLYFVADAYREPRRKGKGKNATILPEYTATEIFEKYAAEELGSTDLTDGQAKIYAHKEFLMMAMLGGKEGMSWSSLPLSKHLLYQKFPEVANQIRRRLAKPASNEGQPKAAKAKQARQGSVDTTASTSSTRRKHGRPRKGDAHDVPGQSSSEASSAVNKQLDGRRGKPTSEATRTTRQRTHAIAEEASEDTAGEDVATPAKDDETDDETDEETKFRARKNKSSLRPRASKGTKSAVRKSGKGLATAEDDDEGGEPPSSPTGGKRKYTDLTESRPVKRRSSKTHVDEGIDIPTSPSASSDAEDDSETAITTAELPLRQLNHIPDPVQEDTWVCALDGCSHKVYAASHPDSQRLIKEHYALHAYDDDDRVQLVKKLQAPSLPAGHLLEKVKQQAKMEGFPGSRQMASRYPMTASGEPVVQKY